MNGIRKWFALISGLVFATVLVFLSPAKMALAIAVATATLVVIRTPMAGMLLFVFLAILAPFSTFRLGIRITLSEAALVLTWIGAGFQLLTGRLVWHMGLTERRVIRLMLYSLVPFVAGQVMVHADGNGVVNWLRWLLNLSPLFLVGILVRDARQREQVMVALLLGLLAMLLLSIGYFLKDRDANTFSPVLKAMHYAHPDAVTDIFSANYKRMASPWVHPNLTGGVLVLFLPMAFFLAQVKRGWLRALAIAVAVLGAAGLLFSISRGAIVSLALVLLWLTWRRAPYAGRVMGVGVALTACLVMFYPPLQHRLATTFSADNASTKVRLDEYRHFPDAVRRYPLGIGFKTDPPPDSDLLGISNLWLNDVYKIGVPGMLLFVATTLAWWREIRYRGWLDRLDETRALRFGIQAGLLAALLTGLFDHYYSFTMVLVALFWTMTAFSLQLARADDRVPELPAERERLPDRGHA